MAEQNKEAGQEIDVSRSDQAMDPFAQMDRWMQNAFPGDWLRPFSMDWPRWPEPVPSLTQRIPKVEVIDREDEVVVRAELPGVEKEDVDVSITHHRVTIKGETRHEEKQKKDHYYYSEISRGAFSRTVTLPGVVDADKAKAQFNNGVLELTIPKLEQARRRSIKIE